MTMALGIIGAITSVVGTLVTAQAQAATANYNAEVAEINKTVSVQQAAADAKAARREQARTIGAIRATAASNGVDMTGSILDVTNDSFLEHELNIKNIAYQGEVKGTDFKNQAKGYKLEAKNIMAAAPINALSAGLSGFGQALRLA